MELLIHTSLLSAIIALIAGASFPNDRDDRILVQPLLNVNGLFNFEPRGPQGNSVGYPWKTRSALPQPLQSPVDIIPTQIKSRKYPPLKIEYAYSNENDGIRTVISNTGHGISVTVPEMDAKPILSGGCLPGRYIFDNIHLHWGSTDRFGSEHFINGEAFALEGHMVTYNTKYRNLKEALENRDDGVAVLTFLAQLSNEENRELNNFIQYVPKVRENGQSTVVNDQSSLLFFLQSVEKNNEYFAYPGSLTTPPFTEAAVFLIMTHPIGVSSSQLALLRTLKDNHSPPKDVISNRREIQPLYGRPVFLITGGIEKSPRLIASQQNNDGNWEQDFQFPENERRSPFRFLRQTRSTKMKKNGTIIVTKRNKRNTRKKQSRNVIPKKLRKKKQEKKKSEKSSSDNSSNS